LLATEASLAKIVVVTHQQDVFSERENFWSPATGNYLLFNVLQAMRRRGHHWRATNGPNNVKGDIAILHVDNTIVTEPYLALAAHYKTTLNFATADISKRCISNLLLAPRENWDGPVMIKSNLNHNGYPEARHNARATAAGLLPPHPGAEVVADYIVLPALAEVPKPVWENPSFVVERFLPELDPQGYALRSWVFMGKAERCTRRVSTEPVVRSLNCFPPSAVEVPESLRAERARLGFDYGKFDCVMREGKAVLLDVNRTPGKPPATGAAAIARAETLADGFEDLIYRANGRTRPK
jgi:hypothetical protein